MTPANPGQQALTLISGPNALASDKVIVFKAPLEAASVWSKTLVKVLYQQQSPTPTSDTRSNTPNTSNRRNVDHGSFASLFHLGFTGANHLVGTNNVNGVNIVEILGLETVQVEMVVEFGRSSAAKSSRC